MICFRYLYSMFFVGNNIHIYYFYFFSKREFIRQIEKKILFFLNFQQITKKKKRNKS
jgi:hypothetical protein